METVTEFIYLGSKITVGGDCSHEIKRHVLLGRKAMMNLDSIFKSRDNTLPTKIPRVKVMVFLVVMFRYDSWTLKKVQPQRNDAFELWCWRRLLRIPWTTRRSNQSVIKEINPWKDWRWSWSSNPLATWCEEPIYWKRPWCWERLVAEGERDNRGWDSWMSTIDSMDMSLSKLWEIGKEREAWCSTVHGVTKSQTQLSDWTTLPPTPLLLMVTSQ